MIEEPKIEGDDEKNAKMSVFLPGEVEAAARVGSRAAVSGSGWAR